MAVPRGGGGQEGGVRCDGDRPADSDPAARLVVTGLKQEMGEVTTRDGSPLDFAQLPIGTMLAFAPHHSCASGCTHPSLKVVRGGVVVADLDVAKGW